MANCQEQYLSNDIDDTANDNYVSEFSQGVMDKQSYDLDKTLNAVSRMDDLTDLDRVFTELQTEISNKADLLKSIEKESDETEMSVKPRKYLVTEIEELQNEEQSTGEGLRNMIEAKRMELQNIYSQQVDDLEQFEFDVHEISKDFMNGPKIYESNCLMEKVLQLKRDLEEKMSEFSQYKKDLQVTEGKLKQNQNTENNDLEIPTKIFEESIEDISSLNEKLTMSVEQLTNQVNSMRFEINSLSLHKIKLNK